MLLERSDHAASCCLDKTTDADLLWELLRLAAISSPKSMHSICCILNHDSRKVVGMDQRQPYGQCHISFPLHIVLSACLQFPACFARCGHIAALSLGITARFLSLLQAACTCKAHQDQRRANLEKAAYICKPCIKGVSGLMKAIRSTRAWLPFGRYTNWGYSNSATALSWRQRAWPHDAEAHAASRNHLPSRFSSYPTRLPRACLCHTCTGLHFPS